MHYPVVIHKDPDTAFGVIVPDLPGCFSAGDSIEDALSQAEDAVLCHLEAMRLDATVVPLPRSVEQHLQDHPEWREGIWALVKIQPDLALTSQG